MAKELAAHPAADVFPLMEGEEFDALVRDIEEHGQREPITLLDGMILDGRNRYRALRKLGIEPRCVHWQTDGDPQAYVISKNIMRRHLSASQRAMIVSRFATIPVGIHASKINDVGNTTSPVLPVAQAAQIAGVDRSMIADAKTVRERGTSEQIHLAEEGEVGVRALAIEIRKANPRQRKEKPKGRTRESYLQKAAFWLQCRKGIDLLVGLPEPMDVINSVPGQQWDRYGPRFEAVAKWMTTFMELYNDSHRNEPRRDA